MKQLLAISGEGGWRGGGGQVSSIMKELVSISCQLTNVRSTQWVENNPAGRETFFIGQDRICRFEKKRKLWA